MGSIPFGLVPIIIAMSTGVKKMQKYYESEQAMNKTIVEYIAGMEVIKIFNRTTASFQKYVTNVEKLPGLHFRLVQIILDIHGHFLIGFAVYNIAFCFQLG